VSYSLHRGAEQDLRKHFGSINAKAATALLADSFDEFECIINLLEEFPDIGKPTGEARLLFLLPVFPIRLSIEM